MEFVYTLDRRPPANESGGGYILWAGTAGLALYVAAFLEWWAYESEQPLNVV